MERIRRNLAIVEELWDRTLTVELISERLECRAGDEPVGRAREYMEAKNWDVLGVSGDGNPENAAVGYVRREDLVQGTCRDSLRDFEVGDLVSGHTPIGQAFQKLCQRGRLFVLGRTGVDSIVTRADLQKQPVRFMLFGAVSLLEMAMVVKVRELYPAEAEWMKLLSNTRLEKALELHSQRRERSQDIDLVDCLQLKDKGTILFKTAGVPDLLEISSRKKAENLFDRLQTVRDNLAHAHDPAQGSDWCEVCEVFLETGRITDKLVRGPER